MSGMLVNQPFDAVLHLLQRVMHRIQKIALNITHVIHILVLTACHQVGSTKSNDFHPKINLK